MTQRLEVQEYIDGILNGDKIVLSRAITLIESKLPSDKVLGQKVLTRILPYSGKSIRIGITGIPGVGKSTFIEQFGQILVEQGKKIAVLAIDPSSNLTKGSILGDKTRMELLSKNTNVYIRPSPTSETLGGIAQKSREAMLLCEAAGFDVIMVETVGVGQSETMVKGMIDFFLLLMLAGAGDELQGIKKGIMELADLVVITKADTGNELKSKIAQQQYQNALHLLKLSENGWGTKVLTCSALNNKGLNEIWQNIQSYILHTTQNLSFDRNRNNQQITWMHEIIRQSLQDQFYSNSEIITRLKSIENLVIKNDLLPNEAAAILLNLHISK